jgi:hypothetical protein
MQNGVHFLSQITLQSGVYLWLFIWVAIAFAALKIFVSLSYLPEKALADAPSLPSPPLISTLLLKWGISLAALYISLG